MRIAFMGTPDFAATCLAELIGSGVDIAAVYTRRPRPSGRGKKLTPSPVQALAETHNLPVVTPGSLRKPETQAAFAALDVDAAIVVAYGLILPREVLGAPRFGCFNLHASLLPRWRGAAPIQRAIMAGDQATGVQVMRMEEGLDTGPILLSETVKIADDDTFASLHDKLARVAAELCPRFLSALSRGAIAETPQSEDGVIYAEKITSAEARIDWRNAADDIDRQIRGLSPFPGAWFTADVGRGEERVKAHMSSVVAGEGAPGEVLSTEDSLVIACGRGAVALSRLQRAGKAAQSYAAFKNGFAVKAGDRL